MAKQEQVVPIPGTDRVLRVTASGPEDRPAPKVVAYIRVSTDKQDAANQRLEILDLANKEALGQVEFVEETVSGRKSWRERSLAGVIEGLVAGDALIVAELSRLGRSMLEIMELLSVLTTKSVRVFAAKGGWRLEDGLQGKIMAMVMAMASEIERELISQRTKAALATKKAQGVRLGRPCGPGKSKVDVHEAEIRELLGLGVTQKRIAKRIEVTPDTLHNWLKRRGLAARQKKGDR
jgi:DNA invertase Pin-like site-specific DNA recombinase